MLPTLPVVLVQDVDVLSEVGLEFYNPVQSPFLPQYTTGRNSPYGEQTLLLLQSLAQQQGLHCGKYADLYAATYNGFDGYMNASTVVSVVKCCQVGTGAWSAHEQSLTTRNMS